MKWQCMVRGCVPLALILCSACSGSQEAPAQYGYGEMFEDSHRTPSEDTTMPVGETQSVEFDGAEVGGEIAMERTSIRRGRSRRQSRREPPPASPAPAVAQAVPTDDSGGEVGAVPEEPSPEPASDPGSGRQPAPTAEGERAAPLMIYQGTLGLAVHNVTERIDEAVGLTHEMGGHVQNQTDTSVVLRVPAPRFREALERFEALGDVLNRRISAQDVSEQVRDIQIRLRNAIQMRDRLSQLLEQAQTVPESLTIEHELERLNETIALMQGQLESFQDRIAFSTITVNFQAIEDQQEIPRELFSLPFSWLNELGLQFLLRL